LSVANVFGVNLQQLTAISKKNRSYHFHAASDSVAVTVTCTTLLHRLLHKRTA